MLSENAHSARTHAPTKIQAFLLWLLQTPTLARGTASGVESGDETEIEYEEHDVDISSMSAEGESPAR